MGLRSTRFEEKSLESPESLLAKLQMTSSVRDYFSKFEKLANQTTEMPPPILKHYFTFGLPLYIKAKILSFRHADHHEAIGLAFLQEQKCLAQPKSLTRPIFFPKTHPVYSSRALTSNPKLNPSLSQSLNFSAASLQGVCNVPFKNSHTLKFNINVNQVFVLIMMSSLLLNCTSTFPFYS